MTSYFPRDMFLHCRNMKYISLILASAVFFCYTGICYPVYSDPAPKTTKISCHGPDQSETSGKNNSGHSFTNPDNTKNQIDLCQDVLIGATYNINFDPGNALHLAAFNSPNLEVEKSPNYNFNIAVKKEYRPPDLFILNSSLLL